MSKSIEFSLNGDRVQADCRADMTVLEWLRGEALLRGTKEGCAEGDCGACSILIKRKGDTNYLPANSCIMLMGQTNGAALMTVEGLAQLGSDGHAVQTAMAENGSSQCGYCTPGIVSALAGLLERNTSPNESEIHDALAGNLCRCTGYRPIVEAAQKAARSVLQELPEAEVTVEKGGVGRTESLFFTPQSLTELLKLKNENPAAVLVAGGTDCALDVAHARARWQIAISTREIVELRQVVETDTHLELGGAVTWGEALPHIEKNWPSFATLVRRFGSVQIRSMGTLGGNLGTASPIGDGAPSLLALNASLILSGPEGDREVQLDDYFISYRKSALKVGEVIKTIKIPLPSVDLQFRVYKISKRYDQDISTVCGAFALTVQDGNITNARIAFGGMAATPVRVQKAEQALIGKALKDGAIAAAQNAIKSELNPMDDMRGSSAYRTAVAVNLLDRFAADIAGKPVEVMAI